MQPSTSTGRGGRDSRPIGLAGDADDLIFGRGL